MGPQRISILEDLPTLVTNAGGVTGSRMSCLHVLGELVQIFVLLPTLRDRACFVLFPPTGTLVSGEAPPIFKFSSTILTFGRLSFTMNIILVNNKLTKVLVFKLTVNIRTSGSFDLKVGSLDVLLPGTL